ncbi:MAG: SDR family oxidoreductase [Leptospirales bacterium]|nr:SDR family oxidoreductase [Leptospirales bacterium]
MQNWKERFGGAALITGASGGLGEEFARQLAARRMDLILVARREDRLSALAQQLQSEAGVDVRIIAADLSAPGAAEKVQSQVQSMGLKVGLLVNNAGYGTYGLFHEIEGSKEANMVALNCSLPVELTHLFVNDMVARKKGGIVFLSSNGAYQPCPFFATYGATKAFNLMLGEALWAELRPFGIDVIALSPGYTRTDFQNVAGNAGQKPMGGWSEPRDVVAQCLNKLGKAPSTIPGLMNYFLAASVRSTPRRVMAMMSYNISKPKKAK